MNNFLKIQDGFYSAKDLPVRVINLMFRILGKRRVFSSDASKSDSDSTYYSRFVDSAVISEAIFKKFRRNYYYRQILEHVDYALGFEYLSRLSKQSIQDLKRFPEVVELSSVGSPRRYFFSGLGLISPTVIRYQHVCQELEALFGDFIGENVVEIGVGFGGQFAVLGKRFKINKYIMFDLPQVLKLTHKVLDSSGVDSSMIVDGDINNPTLSSCDLVISNYAFSELPRGIQKMYIEGVMEKSHRGYLIMNSGKTDFSGRSSGKYTLEELKGVLPTFEILEEVPLSGPDNYVIVWGHKQ